MEDGLWLAAKQDKHARLKAVLILVVMEDGLWHNMIYTVERKMVKS